MAKPADWTERNKQKKKKQAQGHLPYHSASVHNVTVHGYQRVVRPQGNVAPTPVNGLPN